MCGEDSEAASIEGESTLGAIGGLEISEGTHSPVSFGSQTSTSPQTSPVSSHQAYHQVRAIKFLNSSKTEQC